MKETMAYVSATYLWSFTRAEVGLPADATDAEFESAVEAKMEKIIDYFDTMIDMSPNDLEISIA